jgi:hypothetical protein
MTLRIKAPARQVRPGGAIYVLLVSLILLSVGANTSCKSFLAPEKVPPKSAAASQKKKSQTSEGTNDEATGTIIARLEDASIDESSGLVASRRNPGLFWTHNDSGDGPLIFAFDRQGRKRGVFLVDGAKARDWEGIAIGSGPERGRSYLYIGDIGDNNYSREQIVIYRLPEPVIEPGDAGSSRNNPRRTEKAEVIRARYPDGTHDAETLMVRPETGDIYIATKTPGPTSGIYKLAAPPSTSNVNTLARVGEVSISGLFGGMITGGDISPDGRRVVLCDYVNAYELRLDGDSDAAFDLIWQQPPVTIHLGSRNQGEAVCYSLNGAAILATSEGPHTPLIEVELHQPAK